MNNSNDPNQPPPGRSWGRTVIGRCSLCNGPVSAPIQWGGSGQPDAFCERCGAIRDDPPQHLPIIKMKERKYYIGHDIR